ncbi:hypothetical protein HUU61_19035 [Rhodopseudomonas palustris]|nr:hypothetical protein [Rhodopseudomonas palustris]
MKQRSDEKPIFVMIDQSVQKPGGHHYEYAKRILDAAAQEGHDTVLLAHKTYQGSVNHRVIPAFSWTFWDNYNFYYLRRKDPRRVTGAFSRLKAALKAARLAFKRRWLFSPLGIAIGRSQHVSLKDIVLQPHFQWETGNLATPRWLLVLAALGYRAGVLFRRLARPFQRLFRRRGKALAVILLSPIALLILPFVVLRRQNPAGIFAEEASRALKKLDLEKAEATIFVPNATAAELQGLQELAERQAPAASARWAFLYRRPIFSGYPGGYSAQAESTRRFRVEFSQLQASFPNLKVNFYTDTDELTEQYNFLGIYPFATVPVPVDPVPHQHRTVDEALTIGYLGDARDEKGFQHLPDVVAYFRERERPDCDVKFLFQSNYNVPGGEPESRYARGLLEGAQSDGVELMEGPLDSAEYLELLQRMDIVLVPYAAENYSARSSGVLMEALSGRRPAVVPGGSWMAGLIEPFRQAHFAQLVPQLFPLTRVTREIAPAVQTELFADRDANVVVIDLRLETSFDGYVRIAVSSINEYGIKVDSASNVFKAIGGKLTAIFRKVPSSCILLQWVFVDEAIHVSSAAVEMTFSASDKDIPLSAGIATFDGPRGLVAACGDLVDNFDFHREAVAEVADALWKTFHPGTLVQIVNRPTLEAPACIAERLAS